VQEHDVKHFGLKSPQTEYAALPRILHKSQVLAMEIDLMRVNSLDPIQTRRSSDDRHVRVLTEFVNKFSDAREIIFVVQKYQEMPFGISESRILTKLLTRVMDYAAPKGTTVPRSFLLAMFVDGSFNGVVKSGSDNPDYW
jgi:hypothetical protein